MAYKIFFILISAISLIGCSGGSSSQDNKEVVSIEKNSSPLEILKGRLIIGHEVSSFTPCGDSLSYWVSDKSLKLDSLYTQLTKNDKEPYSEVYCEISAQRLPVQDGFSTEYDGLLSVDKVIKLERITLENQCN